MRLGTFVAFAGALALLADPAQGQQFGQGSGQQTASIAGKPFTVATYRPKSCSLSGK